jgi:tRNA nucleotidyltransferase (CCA-adding enzyme)
MARDCGGNLIDPFNGRADIENRSLRHVSAAFAEDPVRILRAAKFAARFHDLGFRIATDTVQLMKEMVANGEADALVPERVWKETEAALAGANPRMYFEVLRESGALATLFAEIEALFGVPQPAKWHPEVDSGLHTMMVLEQAAKLSEHVDVRFAALVHDLGKATTPKSELPSHKGHELRSVKLVKALAKRLPVPNACRDLGCLVAEYHAHCHRAFELRPETILKVLDRADAFRRPNRFDKFLLACEADSRGRKGLENNPYPQADYLRAAFAAATNVEIGDLTNSGLVGADIGKEISRRRLLAITQVKGSQEPPK